MKKKLGIRIPRPRFKLPRPSPRFWLGAIGAAAVLLAGLLILYFAISGPVELPYSVFVAQVEAGNVRAVNIKDGELTGAFNVPLLWPPDDSAPTASHDTFVTIVPPGVTDDWLLPLLDQEGVTVTASRSAIAWRTYLLMWMPLLLALLVVVWVIRRKPAPAGIDTYPVAEPVPEQGVSGAALSASEGPANDEPPPEKLVMSAQQLTAPEPAPVRGFGALRDIEPVDEKTDESDITPEAAEVPRLPVVYRSMTPQETLASVVGQDDVKKGLSEIAAFFRKADVLHEMHVAIPRGLVLLGPPGTGKTLLARALAGETQQALFECNLSDWAGMQAMERRESLRILFQEARNAAPAVILLDELDALGQRSIDSPGVGQGWPDQPARDIMNELDQLEPECRLMVLGAGRSLDGVYPGLLRPGRLERQFVLSLPNWRERLELLRRRMNGVESAPDLELEAVARRTTGLSGADVHALCDRAIWQMIRDERREISQTDFRTALTHLVLAGETSNRLMGTEELRLAAVHEAGHALLSLLLSEAAVLSRLSVLPGHEWTHLAPLTVVTNSRPYKKASLLARLTVILGGQTAEEILEGDITTSAEKDLEHATYLARRMVARWGMSDLGPVSFTLRETGGIAAPDAARKDGYDCSEASAAQIDRAVRVLLEDRHAVARHLLKKNRSLLDHLANLLLREETIQNESLARVMDKISSAVSLEEPRSR